MLNSLGVAALLGAVPARLEAPAARRTLDAPLGRGRAREAVELLGIARRRLARQGAQDEGVYLQPLEDIAHTGATRAERLPRPLENGDPDAAIAAAGS